MTMNKPLAAHGLISYRYAGNYGWIMIGATDHAAALSETGLIMIDGQILKITGKGENYKLLASRG